MTQIRSSATRYSRCDDAGRLTSAACPSLASSMVVVFVVSWCVGKRVCRRVCLDLNMEPCFGEVRRWGGEKSEVEHAPSSARMGRPLAV